MHTIDLGILQHLCGSILWRLTYEGNLQGTARQRLLQIWGRLRELYISQRVDTRMANLTLSMFTDPDRPRQAFPMLSAHAAETRALFPLLAQVCSDLNTGSPEDVARLRCALLF
eukprot:14943691-Alexandrium_andersonii.AAC.1